MSYDPKNRTPYLNSNTPFFTAYGVKVQTPITFPENSPVTWQEFKAESDINTIMAQYMRTGELPQINLQAPQYLDVTNMDFQTHMQYVVDAQNLFSELPSHVRNRFQNDPGAFIDFCGDPENRRELAKMGLLSTDAARAILSPAANTNAAPAAPQAPTAPNQESASA